MFTIVAAIAISNSALAVSTDAIEAFNEIGSYKYVAEESVTEPVVETPIEEPVVEEVTNKNPSIKDATLDLAPEEIVTHPIVEIKVEDKKSSSRSGRISANTNSTTATPSAEEPEVVVTSRLDFNGDNRTGNLDVQLVQSSWGLCPDKSGVADFCMGDADLNGVVNFADITMLLANWSPRMRSDINWDDVVGHADLKMLLNDWLSCPSEENAECRADVNSDGSVNFADITMLLSDWTEVETTPAL